jgi:hypothetical protein
MVIGRNGYVVGVGDDEGFGYAVVMVVVEGFGYAVELYALVLHFCDPRSLPIDILPVSFGSLECSMPSQDKLLFLLESFNFLLDSC